MLKILKLKKHTEVSVRIDDYIPFSIIFSESDVPLYWQCGDDESSLMEIGLNRETGSIESITLTAIRVEHVLLTISKDHFNKTEYPVVEGIPLCDLSLWNTDKEKFENNFYESGMPFSLKLYDDSVLVEFENGNEIASLVQCSNILFGADENNQIIFFKVENLSPDDVRRIIKAIV